MAAALQLVNRDFNAARQAVNVPQYAGACVCPVAKGQRDPTL